MPVHRARDLQETFSLGILLLSQAETNEEKLVALAALEGSLGASYSARFGPRGPYDRVQSKDFVDLLLHGWGDHSHVTRDLRARWLGPELVPGCQKTPLPPAQAPSISRACLVGAVL